jgi:hypothetical protein
MRREEIFFATLCENYYESIKERLIDPSTVLGFLEPFAPSAVET